MADRELPDEIEPASSPADGGVEPAVPSQDEAPPSLRETIEAAARDVGGETAQDGDRPRDASGRFLPNNPERSGTAREAPGSTSIKGSSPPLATPSPAPSDTPAAPSTAPAGPPPGWTADAKALFPSLPPAIQAAVVKREAEVNAGFAQYSQRQKELDQVIGPRRQYCANEGVSDIQAIDNIWKWFEALRHSPQDSFPALAQMFGYDLSTVSPSAAADPQQASPEIQSLRAEIRRLEGQVGQVTGTFEQQQIAVRRAELAAFAKDKPHFEAVRVTMGRLMAAGVAGTLDDAYQQAVKLDPGAAAEVAAAAEKAAAAAALRGRPGSQRRAAVSVRGGSPNGAAGQPVMTSIRESLKAGFAESRGG